MNNLRANRWVKQVTGSIFGSKYNLVCDWLAYYATTDPAAT